MTNNQKKIIERWVEDNGVRFYNEGGVYPEGSKPSNIIKSSSLETRVKHKYIEREGSSGNYIYTYAKTSGKKISLDTLSEMSDEDLDKAKEVLTEMIKNGEYKEDAERYLGNINKQISLNKTWGKIGGAERSLSAESESAPYMSQEIKKLESIDEIWDGIKKGKINKSNANEARNRVYELIDENKYSEKWGVGKRMAIRNLLSKIDEGNEKEIENYMKKIEG